MRRTASQARGIFRREDALHRLRLDGLQLELQVRKWRQHRRGSVGVGSSRGDRGRGADGGISRGRRSCRTAARCGARRWKQRARVGKAKGARGDKDTLSLDTLHTPCTVRTVRVSRVRRARTRCFAPACGCALTRHSITIDVKAQTTNGLSDSRVIHSRLYRVQSCTENVCWSWIHGLCKTKDTKSIKMSCRALSLL
jgi:hypothetical protein